MGFILTRSLFWVTITCVYVFCNRVAVVKAYLNDVGFELENVDFTNHLRQPATKLQEPVWHAVIWNFSDSFYSAPKIPLIELSQEPRLVLNNKAIEVNVTWKYVKYGSDRDYIGVFPCYDLECSKPRITEKNPIQFKNAKDSSYKKYPWLTFRILIRSDVPAYRLAYIAGTPHYAEILAATKPVEIPNKLWKKPRHVRLSLLSSPGNAGKMRVMWTETSLDLKSSKKYNSGSPVWYGISTRKYTKKAYPIAVYTYDQNQLCEQSYHPAAGPGFSPPGLQFEAVMEGLTPGTTYYYSIEGSDEEFSFVAPSRVDRDQGNKMIVMGDMGQSMFQIDGSLQHSFDNDEHGEIAASDTAKSILRLIEKNDVSLVNHIGDISYATGELSLWDSFMYQVEGSASRVPWMTAIGNHEMGWAHSDMPGTDSLGECGVPYAALFPFAREKPIMAKPNEKEYKFRIVTRYPMSEPQAEQGEKLWNPFYSYDHGNVHITVMSTEHFFHPTSYQFKWLEKDLANVNRTVTPWLLFLGHRPMYVSDKYPKEVSEMLLKYVEPLLFKYSVDIAMWGHHHSYQRVKCRVFKDECNDKGTMHIVTGAGGFEHSPFGDDGRDIWKVKTNSMWGVSLLDFQNATHVNITFIENKQDQIIDQFWLIK